MAPILGVLQAEILVKSLAPPKYSSAAALDTHYKDREQTSWSIGRRINTGPLSELPRLVR